MTKFKNLKNYKFNFKIQVISSIFLMLFSNGKQIYSKKELMHFQLNKRKKYANI